VPKVEKIFEKLHFCKTRNIVKLHFLNRSVKEEKAKLGIGMGCKNSSKGLLCRSQKRALKIL